MQLQSRRSRREKNIVSSIMTLTVVVVLTSRAMKLRKTVHVKRKDQLDATKRVKPIPKVRRIDSYRLA